MNRAWPLHQLFNKSWSITKVRPRDRECLARGKQGDNINWRYNSTRKPDQRRMLCEDCWQKKEADVPKKPTFVVALKDRVCLGCEKRGDEVKPDHWVYENPKDRDQRRMFCIGCYHKRRTTNYPKVAPKDRVCVECGNPGDRDGWVHVDHRAPDESRMLCRVCAQEREDGKRGPRYSKKVDLRTESA